MNRFLKISGLILTLIFAVSCSNTGLSRREFNEKRLSEGRSFSSIISSIKNNNEIYNSADSSLYYMDLGMLYHYAAEYDSSITYLKKADTILDELYARSITNETASILVNDNIRPYRSRRYELVMLSFFQMMNYLAIDKPYEGLVESRKTQLLFDEWGSEEGKKYKNDGLFNFISSLLYKSTGERDNSAISLYHSLKSYKEGRVPMPSSLNDYAYYEFKERGRDNDIKELALKEPKEEPADSESEIIIVCYGGKSSYIGEKQFWGTYVKNGMMVLHHRDASGKDHTEVLPAPAIPMSYEKGKKTDSGTTFHIKFAVPDYAEVKSRTNYFSADAGYEDYKSEKFSNLNTLLRQNIDDESSAVMTRTIIRVAVRTITAETAKNKMKTDNPLVNLLLNVGTDLLADQLEMADVRMASWLPSTIQIIRIPVKSGNYIVPVKAHAVNGAVINKKVFENVNVKRGEKKFLFFNSLM